ncbi:hypothetical protein [Arenibaculum pallidiluteum]|uniref:hypothetical protein n=1 Tax=Arenibaculum pallidiluteum TaxID=2812559 RepID=UPI001A97A424|nr:hypothetical protein [Arenibaculum pallidiluteum]
MASKEFEDYAREKRAEGKRIEEGEAHPIANPAPKTRDALDAANAGMHTAEERDVPPDAEGQEGKGHIEQTTTPEGFTQTR